MKLTFDLDDVDVLVITPDGELDLASAPLLGSFVESAVDCGVRRVVVDLSRVTFIDARGVSALVRCRRRAGDDQFSVCSPSQQVWQLLELTGCREAILGSRPWRASTTARQGQGRVPTSGAPSRPMGRADDPGGSDPRTQRR